MNSTKKIFKLNALSLAMMGVFVAISANAQVDEAQALMNPTSSVEVEAIGVSSSSAKFGEYNGLNKQKVYPNGNIDIRGGDGYKKNEDGETTRWSVKGTDLGLSDRSASAQISDQGQWAVGIGYDALTHNLSDTYQTPYRGIGGSNFTLAPGFGGGTGGGVKTVLNSTAANLNSSVPLFQTQDISSTRQNTFFNGAVIIDKNWSANFDYNHLDQSGAKLGAVATSSYGTSPAVANQVTSILPMPTNYQTDTLNMAISWKGEQSHFTASYFGSYFQDATSSVSFQPWSSSPVVSNPAMQSLTTAPNNQFQQLNLSGGYDFSPKTKLAANLSYGANTQNSAFVPDANLTINNSQPASSLNGLVLNTHADIKVTDQSIKDLNLSAAYRYDERNNQTQSNMYNFRAIDGKSDTTGGNYMYAPNTPLSVRNSILSLAGDYKLTRDQKIQMQYDNSTVNRWCNQYASGNSGYTGYTANNLYFNGTTAGLGGPSPLPNGFPAGAQCVTATSSNSNKLGANYKLKANEDLDLKVGYSFDIRKTNYDQGAIAAVGSGAYTGYGKLFYLASSLGGSATTYYQTPTGGINNGNYYGYQPFFEASRNQQLAKATVNWRASEDLTFGLGGRYTYDVYPDSTYGVQNGYAASINLDASYNYAEQANAFAYVTQQNGQRTLTNMTSNSGSNATAGVLPYQLYGTWSNRMSENDTTVGVGFRHAGLMSGKVSLAGDLTYSLGQTGYNTTGAAGASTTPCGTTAGTCGAPPTIRNAMTQVKLAGTYNLDKNSSFTVRYIYQQLNSTDYLFNAYAYGNTASAVLPTNQTSGSYIVNVIAAGYTYKFD